MSASNHSSSSWVTGWLLFDEEHEADCKNTRRGKANLGRATAWEIHPVTSFQIESAPPTVRP